MNIAFSKTVIDLGNAVDIFWDNSSKTRCNKETCYLTEPLKDGTCSTNGKNIDEKIAYISKNKSIMLNANNVLG